jgi:hypothetical protein
LGVLSADVVNENELSVTHEEGVVRMNVVQKVKSAVSGVTVNGVVTTLLLVGIAVSLVRHNWMNAVAEFVILVLFRYGIGQAARNDRQRRLIKLQSAALKSSAREVIELRQAATMGAPKVG